MRYVRVLHEEVAVADDRDFTVLAPPIDGHAFAENVEVADFHPARSPLIGDVLGFVADHTVGMHDIALADLGVSQNGDVTDQPCARAYPYASLEQAERANLDPGDMVIASAVLVIGDQQQRLLPRFPYADRLIDIVNELFAKPDVMRRMLIIGIDRKAGFEAVISRPLAGWMGSHPLHRNGAE